ncbi:NHL repeat-containing protein [Salidesulfovibrio brasiliensis]|uniref:hypothetical protein n=1 Tax=Salidesulfovibrio brasiliensis TaxID=221711 RepID=UPI0006D03174|nr:hypothetical protein [Salidesulfovibrio brasiliensis]
MIRDCEKRCERLVERAGEIVPDPFELSSGGDICSAMDALRDEIACKTAHLVAAPVLDRETRIEDMQFVDRLYALYFETGERLAEYYDSRGYTLAEAGDADAALDLWSRLFAVCPERAHDHAGLAGLANAVHAEKAAAMRERYAFRRLGAARHGTLRYPYAAAASAQGGFVLVSDPNLPELYKFDTTGAFLETVDLVDSFTLGMDADEDGCVWVCDYRNARVISIHPDGAMHKYAGMDDLHPDCSGYAPLKVSFHGGRLYMIMAREADRKDSLLTVWDPSGGSMPATYKLSGLEPGDLCVLGDTVLLLSLNWGLVHQLDLSTGVVTLFSTESFGQRGLGITRTSDALFVCSTGCLCKLDLQGEIVFRRNMFTFGERTTFVQKGITVLEKDGARTLFLPDNSGTVEMIRV